MSDLNNETKKLKTVMIICKKNIRKKTKNKKLNGKHANVENSFQ